MKKLRLKVVQDYPKTHKDREIKLGFKATSFWPSLRLLGCLLPSESLSALCVAFVKRILFLSQKTISKGHSALDHYQSGYWHQFSVAWGEFLPMLHLGFPIRQTGGWVSRARPRPSFQHSLILRSLSNRMSKKKPSS